MKWTDGVVLSKTVWAPGLFTLRVTAPEVAEFEAGQFLQLGLGLPQGEVERPYSVASPHGEVLDFYIVEVEDGQLTPHLNQLNVGDSLLVSESAAGSFTLSHCPDGETLWHIATGPGLAPYIAILRTEEPWQRYQKIVVVHGVRFQSDLSYVEELNGYRETYGGRFTFIPVVSREDGADSLRGRITHCLDDGRLEQRADVGIDQDCAIMMCGNPDMLNDLETQFGERQLVRHRRKAPGQIVLERYW